MRVIAEIDGWRKPIEIPYELVQQGSFEVELNPPLDYLVNKWAAPENIGAVRVRLYHVRDNLFSNGISP